MTTPSDDETEGPSALDAFLPLDLLPGAWPAERARVVRALFAMARAALDEGRAPTLRGVIAAYLRWADGGDVPADALARAWAAVDALRASRLVGGHAAVRAVYHAATAAGLLAGPAPLVDARAFQRHARAAFRNACGAGAGVGAPASAVGARLAWVFAFVLAGGRLVPGDGGARPDYAWLGASLLAPHDVRHRAVAAEVPGGDAAAAWRRLAARGWLPARWGDGGEPRFVCRDARGDVTLGRVPASVEACVAVAADRWGVAVAEAGAAWAARRVGWAPTTVAWHVADPRAPLDDALAARWPDALADAVDRWLREAPWWAAGADAAEDVRRGWREAHADGAALPASVEAAARVAQADAAWRAAAETEATLPARGTPPEWQRPYASPLEMLLVVWQAGYVPRAVAPAHVVIARRLPGELAHRADPIPAIALPDPLASGSAGAPELVPPRVPAAPASVGSGPPPKMTRDRLAALETLGLLAPEVVEALVACQPTSEDEARHLGLDEAAVRLLLEEGLLRRSPAPRPPEGAATPA